jgi:hypothetical protein
MSYRDFEVFLRLGYLLSFHINLEDFYIFSFGVKMDYFQEFLKLRVDCLGRFLL